jgi:hypothetical protein
MANRPGTADVSRGIDLPVGLGITLIGALGIAVGALSRRRLTRSRPTATAKRAALIAYLREHLSGADAAIQVVDHLRRAEAGVDERHLFASLYEELKSDRDVVDALVTRLGASSRSVKRVAGQASGSLLKLMAGGERGELSLFRTLEALAVGIQAKRCMWRALLTLLPGQSVSGRTFAELEAAAVRQWETVERQRRSLVPDTFTAAGDSAEGGPILQGADGRRR